MSYYAKTREIRENSDAKYAKIFSRFGIHYK